MTALDIGLIVVAAALLTALVLAIARRPRGRRLPIPAGGRRLLVPFAGALDERVLEAALRIAKAEESVLVPAYLLIVPLQYGEDSPLRDEVEVALPLLEAVERAALGSGIPVDARIEKGRSRTHALRRLWEVERFDRILVPAPSNGRAGFTEEELAWLLVHTPPETETLVLKPARPSERAVSGGQTPDTAGGI
jgi:hypothetical protein